MSAENYQPASAEELQYLIKQWRQGRATTNIWQALQDAYIAVLAVVVLSAMVINMIVHAQTTTTGCTTDGCLTGRALLPWATLAGVLAATLAVCHIFGPVVASAAEGFWLLDAPISRARILRKRLWLALGASLAVGILVGALISALTGWGIWDVLIWALATGLGAAGLTAFAAMEQTAERGWIVRIVQLLFGTAAVFALVVVVGVSADWFQVGNVSRLGRELALGTAGVGLVLLLAAGVAANARLNRIRRTRLLSAGALISGMQGAMFGLDFGLARDILVAKRFVEKGHVRATRGIGSGLASLVWRDVQRLGRYPQPFIGLIVSVAIPYAVEALGFVQLSPVISGLVLMLVLIPFMGSLRVISRTNGLARCLPFSSAQIRQAAMVVPGALALLWGLAAVPAFLGLGQIAGRSLGHAILTALLTGAAGFLGAVRWVSAKHVDFSMPMVATEMGAMPTGMMANLFRGIDMVMLITFPIALGLPFWVSAALAGIVFVVLRGTFNLEEIKEAQEEQKKLAAEAKAQAQTKRKIQRKKR